MASRKRIAVMITLDDPVQHHYGVFAGVRQFAEEQNWESLVDPYAHEAFIRHGRRVYDGVVGRITKPMAQIAKQQGVPLVNVLMNTSMCRLASVFPDARQSGRIAGEHLMGRGFRHFACLGRRRDVFSRLELAGMRDVVEPAGYACTAHLVNTSFERTLRHYVRFQSELMQWIASWTTPIGIFASHDLLAYYLLEACRDSGLQVPREVGVVGSYNEPIICLNARPSLTSIDYGFERIGYRAGQLLMHLMNGGAIPAEPILIQPAELRVRGSSDAMVVNEPRVAQALQYIANHACKSVGINEVAARVHVSQRTLARLFNDTLGRSIHSEISRLRVEYLKRRLIDSDVSINALAAECGFSSPSHLSRLFYRVTGIRPGEYRRRRT